MLPRYATESVLEEFLTDEVLLGEKQEVFPALDSCYEELIL